jgi:ArsR family transcriptional regulator, arsenate/arsenite/antimonite-responsive transcriptional repressor / arsenate reductase (thioredoxin)
MGPSDRPLKRVLFLCTGNSARSQMAEALLRHVACSRFEAFSAGTTPRENVHPEALQTLRRNSVPVEGLSTKDAARFAGERFDYVITLCDPAREHCPHFDVAETMHWTFADPAAVSEPADRKRAFDEIFAGLSKRLRFLVIVNEKN